MTDTPKPVRNAKESAGCAAIYLEVVGAPYKFQGVKDAEAWFRMRKGATVEEIEQRWRIGLAAQPKAWHHVSTLAQLDSKWNDLGSLVPHVPKSGSDSYVCEDCGATVDASTAGRIVFNKHHVCAKCFTAALAADAVAVNETQRGGER